MEENAMSDISKFVLIGGSAGSLQAIISILGEIGPGFTAPVLLVLHRVPGSESNLEEFLAAKTHLKVIEVEEKEPIRKGCLYTCPPGYHVLIEPGEAFSLDVSEKVNFSRPSLDVVFKSAADIFGKRLVAVLLSGANMDGAKGLENIQEKGGVTIVQEPAEAMVAYMPMQALKLIEPDHILPAKEIGMLLNQL
jgi:two-component system chemotaxis response regulator CheB